MRTRARTLDDAAPSLRTGMGNVLLQTPFPIAGMQFYVTLGAGGYRERLGEDPSHDRRRTSASIPAAA